MSGSPDTTRGTPSPGPAHLHAQVGAPTAGDEDPETGASSARMETLSATLKNSVSHELAEGMPGTNSSHQTQVQTASPHRQHFASKSHHFVEKILRKVSQVAEDMCQIFFYKYICIHTQFLFKSSLVFFLYVSLKSIYCHKCLLRNKPKYKPVQSQKGKVTVFISPVVNRQQLGEI